MNRTPFTFKMLVAEANQKLKANHNQWYGVDGRGKMLVAEANQKLKANHNQWYGVDGRGKMLVAGLYYLELKGEIIHEK